MQRLCAFFATLTAEILHTTEHCGTTRAIFSPAQIGCTTETATVNIRLYALQLYGTLPYNWDSCQNRRGGRDLGKIGTDPSGVYPSFSTVSRSFGPGPGGRPVFRAHRAHC